MVLEDFFKESQTVIWTSEYLKYFMTTEIVGLEEDYNMGEAVIAECHDISLRNKCMCPIVIMELTCRSDRSHKDYLYYIPETNSMGLWYGSLTYKALKPHAIGTDFVLMLPYGSHIRGKIIMYQKQLCFQFKQNYDV